MFNPEPRHEETPEEVLGEDSDEEEQTLEDIAVRVVELEFDVDARLDALDVRISNVEEWVNKLIAKYSDETRR